MRRTTLVALLAVLPLSLAGCHHHHGAGAKAATASPASPSATGAAKAVDAGGTGGPKTISVAAFRKALPAVDPTGLTGHQRALLVAIAEDAVCTCGQSGPPSLAGCLEVPHPCLLARRMVRLAGLMIAGGLSTLEATDLLEKYYGGFPAQARKHIPIDPKTCLGPKHAKVTLVEFADFQCPHCRRAFPLIHRVVARDKGRIRWCYLNFPLPQHPEARAAAEVAEMAKAHGKFFQMARLLFAHQKSLSTDELETLGKQVGLKPAAVKRALADKTYQPIVKRQFEEAVRLHLTATPTLFINGRKLVLPVELLPWAIDDELLYQANGNSWKGNREE